jgi:3-keto-5-aminohexanoate cleavage enzyme
MDPPTQWKIHALAIAMGGHVRVGWEDNPYLPDGTLARSNAELVEVAVRLAKEIGREVATPEEARRITGVRARAAA